MIKTYCDICGKEIKYVNYYKDVYMVELSSMSNTSIELSFEYNEICHDCADKIVNYINEMKQSS